MSDLIDRQAAIDSINKIFPADPLMNEYIQGLVCGAALAKAYIEQMPPAQLEESETRPLLFEDYAVALVAMWMDNIVTNEEYKMIMAKVIAHEKAERRKI